MALVSPAGPLADMREAEQAVANARALGWDPQLQPHATGQVGYFAATDAQRATDLRQALTNPAIDGIWCLRGGYGSMRLLPALDDLALAAHPKTLLGFSDITALHALWQRAGVVSFHGPTARAVLSPFSERSLRHAVCDRMNPASECPTDMECLVPGAVDGRLVGGNLAVLTALVGTPWAVSFAGAIAVLEDIGEPTYRVDRLLTQLQLSGAFRGCRGLLVGQCTDCPDSSRDETRSWRDLMYELGTNLRIPTLIGAPIGHIADQWTVPLGAHATLDATRGTLAVHRFAA